MLGLYQASQGSTPVEIRKASNFDFDRFVAIVPQIKDWVLLHDAYILADTEVALMYDKKLDSLHVLFESDIDRSFEFGGFILDDLLFDFDEVTELVRLKLKDDNRQPNKALIDVIAVVPHVDGLDRKQANQHPYVEIWEVNAFEGDLWSINQIRKNSELPGIMACVQFKAGELLDMLQDPVVVAGSHCLREGKPCQANYLNFVRLQQLNKIFAIDSVLPGSGLDAYLCTGVTKSVDTDEIFDVLASRNGLIEWLRHLDRDAQCKLIIRDDVLKGFGRGYTYKTFRTLPNKTFKTLPYPQESVLENTIVPSQDLKELLSLVKSSVAEIFYHNDAMTYAHLTVEKKDGIGTIQVYGSDSHQLMQAERSFVVPKSESHGVMKFVIPYYGIVKLIDLLGDEDEVELANTIAGGMVKWVNHYVCFDGPKQTFPPLEKVLNAIGSETTQTVVNREDLKRILSQGSAPWNRSDAPVFVELKRIGNELHACFNKKNTNEMSECWCSAFFMPVKGSTDVPDFKLQFEPILHVLESVDDDFIQIRGIPNDCAPVAFSAFPATDWNWLMMPVKRTNTSIQQ